MSEMSSDDLYAKPGIIMTREYDKESVVDIYVSAESLRVYDNPWVEGMSPNIPAPTGAQHTVSVVSGRRNHVRTSLMFLRVLCVLLLAGILVLICLEVQMKKDEATWSTEKTQLLAEIANLSKIIDQLKASYSEFNECCDLKHGKCKDQVRSECP